MGRSYWFECSKCGYRAKVSGGADKGVDLCVQTLECTDCRALHDAVVRMKVPDERSGLSWGGGLAWRLRLPSVHRRDNSPPTLSTALNRLPYKGVPRYRWLQYRLQCPVSSFHKVKPWNDPGRCPKCGSYLDKSALPFRLWD